MGKFKDFIISWILENVGGFDTKISDVSTILTQDIFSGDIYTLVMQVFNIVKPISLTIIGIIFFIELLKLTIKTEVLEPKYMLTVFFKLCFAKACIDGSIYLLSAIYATATEWITGIGSTNTGMSSAKDLLESSLNAMGKWEVLGLAVSVGVMVLAVGGIAMLIKAIAYARVFELSVYLAIAPLPCAFLPMENSRIPKKYFLTFASVSLQGVFIILSTKLYGVICSSAIMDLITSDSATTTDMINNIFMGAIVLLMAVIKSGSWAKGILAE